MNKRYKMIRDTMISLESIQYGMTEEEILSAIHEIEALKRIQATPTSLTIEEKESLITEATEWSKRHQGQSQQIVREGHKPWMHQRSADQQGTYYIDRYKKHLTLDKGMSPLVVTQIFNDADKILDCMANPLSEDGFKKKGLVIGHVQSGKSLQDIALREGVSDSYVGKVIVARLDTQDKKTLQT